ncbi:hypothetical protein SteCoe_25949 [Stentor coeruleus]|uniref:Ion transport domain-containing protein n=1 Tax=Stentor coeruleus TaxID=5963 RepID=A0A1R2BE04_9CILI|nr:hypothetical protein SteCoe_25949 [Stentor coeruleus]
MILPTDRDIFINKSLAPPIGPTIIKTSTIVAPFLNDKNRDIKIPKGLRGEMQYITSYFSEFKPSQIITPFQGTCLLMSKDKTKFYFGSREGRIAIAKIENKEILHDYDLGEGIIRTIALYQNDKYIFSGGQGGVIRKFLISDMSKFEKFIGHTRDVNSILISSDELSLFSLGDNGDVFYWDLQEIKPTPKMLYSHNCEAYALDLSSNNLYLASGGMDRSVTVYSLASMAMVKKICGDDIGTVWCIKITEKNTYIAFGDDMPNVYVYNFEDWSRICLFKGHKEKVRCMTSTSDEMVIISGGNDKKIFIWDIKNNRNGLVLKRHENGVKSLILSADNKRMYSMSDDCSIKNWKLPKYDHYSGIKTDLKFSNISKMIMGKTNPNKIFILKDREIISIDKVTSVETYVEIFNVDEVKCFAFSILTDIIVIIGTNKANNPKPENSETNQTKYDIIIYDYHEAKCINSFTLDSSSIYSVMISADDKFIVIGEHHRCIIYYSNDFSTPYHIFRTHKCEIVSIVDSPNGSYLFSGDVSGVIKSYDFPKKYEIKSLIASDKRVTKMIVTPDNEYMIASHSDFSTNIWVISKMIKIHTMRQENLLDIKFPKNSTILFSLYETSIKGFSIPSLVSCFAIRLHKSASKFCFNSDESEITVFNKDSISIYKSPQHCHRIRIFGELKYLNYFYNQIGKLVNGKFEKHDSKMNHLIIEPFHVNMMHLYAYLDKPKFLKQCFEENVGFFPSASGFSPLDICLEMAFEETIDLMYIEIKKLSRRNPLFLSILENSLVRLNSNSYANVHRFYKLAIYKTIDTRLPHFYKSKRKLPIIIFTPNVLAHKSSFMPNGEYSNDGVELSFTQTYFRINMIPGSKESLEFIKSIIESSNESLFTTEFIRTILSEKWGKVYLILYLQALIYSSYLGLISAYSVEGDFIFLTISFALNTALILYEICQVFTGRLDYFKDVWNYIDIVRSAIMTFLFLNEILNVNEKHDVPTAIVLFVSWIRGISYFRLVENTRYYVNLIYEVFFDIIPFLTILFYSTVAFSLIFHSLMSDSGDEYAFLKTSWEINVGGFDTSKYKGLMYVAFFLNTVLNPIIMLNLLISIMSNTYKRVNKQVVIADSKELAGMILECELIFFWNRNKTFKHYLHICSTKKKGLIQESDMFKKIKAKIFNLKQGQVDIMSQFNSLTTKLKKMKKSTNIKLDIISKSVHELIELQKSKDFK